MTKEQKAEALKKKADKLAAEDKVRQEIQLAKDKERAANQPDTTNKPTRAKLLQFGGNRLGGSRMKLHRKKNNRSTK